MVFAMPKRGVGPASLALLTLIATPAGAQTPAPPAQVAPAATPAPVLAQPPSGPDSNALPSNALPKDLDSFLKAKPASTPASKAAGKDETKGAENNGAKTPAGDKTPAEIAKAAAKPLPSVAAVNSQTYAKINESARAVDPVVLKAEILLDRAHAPPGVIDGRYGANFVKAIRVFEEVHGLEVDGKLSKAVWDALGGDTAAPVLGPYTITAEDVKGPFYPDLSPDYAEQAKLPDLGYRSPEEMFGERFHMDRKFLRALNPNVDMGVAGNTIIVARVDTKPLTKPIARIDVDKGRGEVLAYDADNLLIVGYPATIGSEELPSPSGSYVVRGVAPHPTYTYDPKKNFQQGKNTQKLILPPGPNNPVGAAFIALSKPTYGIHGTPDPSKIDKTHSHGCVRLTNWNATELSKLVKVGTPVNFIERPLPPLPPDLATASDPIGELAAPGAR